MFMIFLTKQSEREFFLESTDMICYDLRKVVGIAHSKIIIVYRWKYIHNCIKVSAFTENSQTIITKTQSSQNIFAKKSYFLYKKNAQNYINS